MERESKTPEAVQDPGPIMQVLTGYWASSALKAAMDLDLFTHVGRGHDTVEAIAGAAAASRRGVRTIADAMCSLGFLAKSGGRYALPPLSRSFLTRDGTTCVGDFSRFVTHEHFWSAFSHTTEAAMTGRSQLDGLAPENPLWKVFAESSSGLARVSGAPLVGLVDASRPGLKILDVAAGSGEYGIAVAKASEGSRVTFLDWKNVLEVTRRHAEAAGLGTAARYLGGDALRTDWGGPYDVVVASHFLHHFGREDCVAICRKARAAVAPGGVFATQEFVADEDRAAPGFPLLFAVAMLVWTDAGTAYTFSEIRSMLADGGFREIRQHRLGEAPASWILAS